MFDLKEQSQCQVVRGAEDINTYDVTSIRVRVDHAGTVHS